MRSGAVSVEQADAILDGLTHLPRDLGLAALERADQEMVAFARTYTPPELRRLANRIVDVVAPAVADQDAAAYLARVETEARRTRCFHFYDDRHGSWRFRGEVPIVDGSQVAELVNALARAGDNNRINTPEDEALGREERCCSAKCADALLEIMRSYRDAGAAPGVGGDRPRINVTIDLALLRGQLGHAVLGNGAAITAGEARRLACDANILPVVLDGPSAPVDVGRDHRLVSGALRLVLNARDEGCCFPGCENHQPRATGTTWFPGGPVAEPLWTTPRCCVGIITSWSSPLPTSCRPSMGVAPGPPWPATRVPADVGGPEPRGTPTRPVPVLSFQHRRVGLARGMPEQRPIRVCMVCTGNICRSPMAEIILRKQLERAGLSGGEAGERVVVDSVGMEGYHVGDGADPRTLQVLHDAGYDGSAHIARKLDPAVLAERDLILVADSGHLAAVRRLARRVADAGEIHLMREFDPEAVADGTLEVDDPYYGDAAAFRRCLREVEAACAGLVRHLGSLLA
jgi:protein-tyrosine phosphatase